MTVGGGSASLTTPDFDFIRGMVRREAAIVLEPGKEYLVESRLIPLARQEGEQSISGLVSKLRSEKDGRIAARVVDAMTTNETSFFRDVHPFDALGKLVVPDLIARRPHDRRLTVWCGASSSGQEPYTLAMVLSDVLERNPGWSASITATDISAEMLERTRTGRYSQLEVNRGLPVSMLVRWFDKVGMDWQVKQPLRSMVQTRPLNLSQPFPAMGPFDVVFLRNVLIYFDTETKRQVLQRVRRVLRPDGLLFLGSAETTLTIDDSWERVVLDRATAYRPR